MPTCITLPTALAEKLRAVAAGTSVSPHRVGVVALGLALDLLAGDAERLAQALAEAEEARRAERAAKRGAR